MDSVHEDDNRKAIVDYILENPGSHLRMISREINMKMGTLRHHLRRLEKQRIVTTRKERNLKIYFASGKLEEQAKNISPLLQQKRFKDIILTIIISPGLNQKTLSLKTHVKPSTLSKYLHILEDRDIIFYERIENEKHYYVHDPERIMRFLREYKKSFWDPFVDNALEIFLER